MLLKDVCSIRVNRLDIVGSGMLQSFQPLSKLLILLTDQTRSCPVVSGVLFDTNKEHRAWLAEALLQAVRLNGHVLSQSDHGHGCMQSYRVRSSSCQYHMIQATGQSELFTPDLLSTFVCMLIDCLGRSKQQKSLIIDWLTKPFCNLFRKQLTTPQPK